MVWHEALALGAIGGALPDILRIIKCRYDESAPPYLTRYIFWVSLALLVGLGRGFSVLLAPARGVDALAIGFSAPTLVTSLLLIGDQREK